MTYDKSKFSKTGELIGAVTVEDDEVLFDKFRWNNKNQKPRMSQNSAERPKG